MRPILIYKNITKVITQYCTLYNVQLRESFNHALPKALPQVLVPCSIFILLSSASLAYRAIMFSQSMHRKKYLFSNHHHF